MDFVEKFVIHIIQIKRYACENSFIKTTKYVVEVLAKGYACAFINVVTWFDNVRT